MIINLYCIEDFVAKSMGPIFQAKNDGVASRNFHNFMNAPENANLPKADYGLLWLGTFDDETGTIVSTVRPVLGVYAPEAGVTDFSKKEEIY